MKKLLAMILAVVMILSLCTVAFATDTTAPVTPVLPTDKDGNPTSTIAATPTGIISITVNGDTAVYHTDSNGVTYIRAIDNPDNAGEGGTEWALRNATVEIVRESTGTIVTSTEMTLNGDGTTLTADVDLFNKAYTLVINGTSYILAAGLPSGAVAIGSDDPLRMSSVTVNGTTVSETATAAGAISATNIQNPYIGNTSASGGKWTYITYKADIACTSAIANRASVSASYTLPNGATAVVATDDNNSCLTPLGQFKLDVPSPRLEVTATVNGVAADRDYYIFATDASSFNVKFGIDFTEAMTSTYYTGGVKIKVNKLKSQAEEYFGTAEGLTYGGYGTITVTSGETVMDIMRKFAVKYGYTSEVPEGCTYMAKLNGIGEFDFGQYSGWMYTDSPRWNGAGAALYETWSTPPVGGADYTLSAGKQICWFICCNYMHHPWN